MVTSSGCAKFDSVATRFFRASANFRRTLFPPIGKSRAATFRRPRESNQSCTYDSTRRATVHLKELVSSSPSRRLIMSAHASELQCHQCIALAARHGFTRCLEYASHLTSEPRAQTKIRPIRRADRVVDWYSRKWPMVDHSNADKDDGLLMRSLGA